MNSPKYRTTKGTYRRTRKDTLVGTIEKKYGVDLGVRSDMKLSTYFEKKGYPSLSRMIRDSNE